MQCGPQRKPVRDVPVRREARLRARALEVCDKSGEHYAELVETVAKIIASGELPDGAKVPAKTRALIAERAVSKYPDALVAAARIIETEDKLDRLESGQATENVVVKFVFEEMTDGEDVAQGDGEASASGADD